MNVYANLIFQKKYFPLIFEDYNKSIGAEKEVAASIDDYEDEIFLQDEILIYCNEFEEILTKVLSIPQEIITGYHGSLEEYESVLIKSSYYEVVKENHSDNSIEIAFTLPFGLKFFNIRLVKRLNKRYLSNSVNLLVLKGLDFYDEAKLKGKAYKKFDPNALEKLKEYLIKIHFYYSEQSFIEQCLKKKELLHNEDILQNSIQGSYDTLINMEVLKQLKKDIKEKKLSHSDYNLVIIYCLNEFLLQALEILKNFITEPDFVKNFIIVELYINSFNDLKSKLTKFVFEVAVPQIEKISRKAEKSMDIDIELLSSKIVEVDEIIKEQIKNLYNEIRGSIRKVC